MLSRSTKVTILIQRVGQANLESNADVSGFRASLGFNRCDHAHERAEAFSDDLAVAPEM